METATLQRPKIDVKLVAPFIESVKSVFETMANIQTKFLTPHIKKVGHPYNVFGIIGFSGQLTGAVTVGFTMAAAEKIVEAFTGSKAEPTSANFADAIGELANMIAGSAKSKLGLDARITVPTVIIGDRCQMAALSGVPCLVVPCTSAMGEFAVEICIAQKNVA